MHAPDPNKLLGKNTDGFFLVGVLVFCFILIPLIAAFAQSSKVAAMSAGMANERLKVNLLAEGLAEALATRLATDQELLERFDDFAPVTCRFQRHTFRFSVQDHGGKIDLNDAGSALLQMGFKAAGLSDQNARILQQFVEASRSGSVTPEASTALSMLPSLKRAPFERVEELNDVISALKLAQVDFEPLFTTYTRSGVVDYSRAVKRLREALDASPDLKDQRVTDRKTFDYIDITVDVSGSGPWQYHFAKTFARLSTTGDVVEIATQDLPNDVDVVSSTERQTSSRCGSLLGLEGEAAAHV